MSELLPGPAYTRTVQWDTNRDGVIDNVLVGSYWRNADGDVLREFSETDSDNDGKIDFTRTINREFYDGGLVKSELTSFDNLTNDAFDKADLSEYRYDDAGDLVWFRSSFDFRTMGVNADGVWDTIYTQETTLDEDGRVAVTFSRTDWDADGIDDAVARSVYRYDESGFQVFRGDDYDNDGTFNYTDEVVFHDALVS